MLTATTTFVESQDTSTSIVNHTSMSIPPPAHLDMSEESMGTAVVMLLLALLGLTICHSNKVKAISETMHPASYRVSPRYNH